jgi:hypothetical protein
MAAGLARAILFTAGAVGAVVVTAAPRDRRRPG